MAGTGAASSILCTTPLEAGCRRPYEATEPTASAHQRSDPVGIRFCTLRRHRVGLVRVVVGLGSQPDLAVLVDLVAWKASRPRLLS